MGGSPLPRRGNMQRAEWRRKCRQSLAHHLTTQLGFTVQPDQVRLQPRVDDGYAWIRQPEREHLFTKQLSKHSVGAYMELYRELGTSIEAIMQPNLTITGQCSKVSTSIMDLQSQVSQLQAETTKLLKQSSHHESQAQIERNAREQAEHRIRRLEDELSSSQTERDNLWQETMQLYTRNGQLEKSMHERDKEVKKALSAFLRFGDTL